MGRATIISESGDGLYTIEQTVSLPGQAEELARLIALQATLETKIEAAQADLDLRELEVDATTRTLSQTVTDMQLRKAQGKDPDPPIDPVSKPADGFDPAYVTGAASGCLAAHNAIRTAAGLYAYTNNSLLAAAAQGHADWLANNNKSGHTGQDSSSPQQRIEAAGYTGRYTGENQAAGHTSVAAVMEGWMNSQGHKANVLDTDYTEMGTGYAYRPDGMYVHYWVVNFGAP